MANFELPMIVDPIHVYSGDTLQPFEVTIKDNLGVAINLSQYTWLAQWRPTPSHATVIALSVDSTDAATGRLRISATAAQTLEMQRSGVWDVQGTSGSEVTTWLRGTTVFEMDVSR